MPRTQDRLRTTDGFVPIRIQDRPSRSRQVFDELRMAIVRGELPPNSLFSVTELAGRFGVSRTPVREALIELASMGMVRFERNRGFRILESSTRDLEEIFELRILLEVPATRMAAEKAKPEDIAELDVILDAMRAAAQRNDESDFRTNDRLFHRSVLLLSGNRRLTDFVEMLRDLVLVRGATTSGRSESLDELLAAHQRVFDYIKSGAGQQAAAAMEAHLRHTQRMLLVQRAREPGA